MNGQSPVLEVRFSAWKLFKYVLLGGAMTALCVAIAFGYFTKPAPSMFVRLAADFGIVLFGGGTLLSTCYAIARLGKPVITLSPDGIRDDRVAKEIIPWSAVESVSTRRFDPPRSGAIWPVPYPADLRLMILRLKPEAEKHLCLTAASKLFRRPNRALGVDGIVISPTGLDIEYDELFDLSTAYVAAAAEVGGQPAL
ncbi:STM3941 family protein [Bradyrhizobium embrapense]